MPSTGLFDSFTTGLSQGIDEIDFLLTGSGSITVKLFGNSSNNTPGALLFEEGFIPIGGDLAIFYPTFPPTVQAHTRYWIGLFGSNGWDYSSDTSANGVAGQYWAESSGIYPNSVGHGPFQMDLGDGAIIVPEPATWALAFVGFIGLGLAGLRRRGGSSPIET